MLGDDSWKTLGKSWTVFTRTFEFLIWDGVGSQDIWNLDLAERSGLKMKLSDCVRITKGGS